MVILFSFGVENLFISHCTQVLAQETFTITSNLFNKERKILGNCINIPNHYCKKFGGGGTWRECFSIGICGPYFSLLNMAWVLTGYLAKLPVPVLLGVIFVRGILVTC